MSFLDHDGLSRRSPEPRQSPFRARGLDSTTEEHGARSQTPSTGSGPQHRRHPSKTGTLRGAFEATRVPTVSEVGEEGGLLVNGAGEGLSFDEASFLDEAVGDSPRRKTADHDSDKRRLRQAMTSFSPAFSRDRPGTFLGLTADNLQRREEEQLGYDQNAEPSLNLPSTWGSRATNRRDWMRDINRRSEARSQSGGEEQPAGDDTPRARFGFDSSKTRGSPRHKSLADLLREREMDNPETGGQSNPSAEQSADGGNIPNTPVSVYRNSTFNRRSPSKRDSQDLLRRLSRTESPRLNQSANLKTPEPTKPPERHIYDKTPVVTGAWIDTPMTEKAQPVQLPASSKDEPDISPLRQRSGSRGAQPEPRKQVESEQAREQAREQAKGQEKTKPIIKPELPKSGLETYLRDFQTGEGVGDETMRSLQMILEEPEAPVQVKSEAEEDAEFEKAVLKELKGTAPIAEKTETVKTDEETSSDYQSRLDKLAQRLRDITEGLYNIEVQAQAKGEDCHTCGANPDGRIYTTLLLPYLWRRDPVSRRPRPTRLGWCLLIFLLWLFSESTMCDYYCHPTYATVCNDNCLKPDAPEFPFVIPTMLWRWSHLSSLLAPAITIVVAFVKLVAQLLGLWDGYVDDAPGALNLAGEIKIHGSRVGVPMATPSYPNQAPQGYRHDPNPIEPLPWDDPDSMDDDEIL